MKSIAIKSILRAVLTGAACAVVSLAPRLHAGSHTWSGLGGDGKFSNPQNWSSGGVPEGRESNVILVFPAFAADKAPIQNIANLGIDQMVIQGDDYFFSASGDGNYFLRGGTAVDIDNGSNHATHFDASAALILNDDVTIQGSSGSVLIDGPISGSGGLTVTGPTVEFAGSMGNTYTGLTFVENGILRLNKSSGVGFAGDLKIGITYGADDNERVVLLRANQIPDGSDIVITSTGWLNLNGYNDTVHDITMTSARISTGAGSLSLLGQIHVYDDEDSSTLAGKLNLGAATRTINVESNALFDVLGTISGAAGAGIYKHGAGALWLSESNSFSGPLRVYAGQLGIFDGWALGTAAGRTYVHAGAELVTYGASVLSGEGLNLNGQGGPTGPGALKADGFGSPTWKGDFVLESDASIAVKTNRTLILDGPISGPGGWTKVGDGGLMLDGSTPNTYAGETRILGGALHLMKNDSVTAIPGSMVIGEDINNAPTNTVHLVGNHQIADNALITLHRTGFLDLDGNSEKIGPLTMTGGTIHSANGLLTLDSQVTAYDGAIHGNVRLLGPTTFHLPVNAAANDLYIGAAIQGGLNADLIKTGPGVLDLAGTNTFLGETLINEGVLMVRAGAGLGGSENGTVVNDGGMLVLLFGPQVSNEALVLKSQGVSPQSSFFYWLHPAATNVALMAWATDYLPAPWHDHRWNGPITLEAPSQIFVSETNDVFTIGGTINGPGGLAKVGLGKLVLAGTSPNTYQGGTSIKEGPVHLAKTAGVNAIPGDLVIGDGIGGLHADAVFLMAPSQIADGATVNILASGDLDLNNFSETVGGLMGNGRVYCQAGTLSIGGNNQDSVWAGGIQGNAVTTLIKNGTGTFRIDSDNYYFGRTLVQAGAVDVRGSIASSTVRLQGAGHLEGTGTVGNIENLMGGMVSPGAVPGVIHSGSAAFNAGSMFKVDLQGAVPGTGHDQLDVTGTVNLGSASLQAVVGNSIRMSSTLMIVKNDGGDAVVGTFEGLPQGAALTLSGQRFQIVYNGGDGNDVVLTRVNTPPSLSTITATAFIEEGGNIHINGAIVDPDTDDSFTFVVNWGDGSPEQTVNLAAGTQLFHIEHTYTDDKPGAQPSDSFMINYTLKDSSGSPAFGQLNTVIGNVSPTVFGGGTVGVAAGEVLNSTLTFADPGSDSWTATIDYGDGSGAQPLTVGAGKSLPFTHAFSTNGIYTVTVEVMDDDTGKGATTFQVVVGLQLSIAKKTATQAALSWPGNVTGFVVQQSPEIKGTNWTVVPGQPQLLDNQWMQIVESTNIIGFFRLFKP